MKMLVTGGARSGKSSFALKVAEATKLNKYFIATAEALDDEMKIRIDNHRIERAHDWNTVEEPVNIAVKIDEIDSPDNFLLIDCLGLWTSNLLLKFGESEFERKSEEFLGVLRGHTSSIILVSNEVGLGIVPADPISRQFRDCLGKLNQAVANICDEAVFMVSGMPLWLKGNPNDRAGDK